MKLKPRCYWTICKLLAVAVIFMAAGVYFCRHYGLSHYRQWQHKYFYYTMQEKNPGIAEDDILLNTDFVSDYREPSGIAKIRSIESVSLSGKKVVDISPLEGMKLKSLTLINTGVVDLSPLSNMPLEQLDIFFSCATDFSPLHNLDKLSELSLSGRLIRDVFFLRGLHLKSLTLHATCVSDLSPLSKMRLKSLDLRESPVMDIAPLTGMPLEKLKLSGTGVSDLSPLIGMPLWYLDITGTPAANKEIPGELKILMER